MSSKEKDSKSLQDRLKDIFKFKNKGQTGTLIGKEFVLTEDYLIDLRKESPLSTRIKILKLMIDIVAVNKLENNAVEKLWSAVEDLFGKEHTTDTRHLAFTFIQSLIKGQYDKLHLMRAQFFRFIKNHDHPDDVEQRLDLLITLTSKGKDNTHFEEAVGPFLLNWLPEITRAGKIQKYLCMFDNVIKFNPAFMSEDVVSRFIQQVCVLSCTTNDSIVNCCLEIMSAVVAYRNMSPDSLPKFIGALCRTVNSENNTELSWKIMKNLLGTHMGHSALYTMCKIIQEPALKSEIHLLQGAVFFIYTSLWGPQYLATLHCPPSSIMPSFLHAVRIKHPLISYEVILGMHSLVSRYRYDLQDSTWSTLFEIVALCYEQMEASPNSVATQKMLEPFHETLTLTEGLIGTGHFNGSPRQFFEIIEACSTSRSEESVTKLVTFLSESIVPTEHLWLTNLYNLMHKYFKSTVCTNVRLKVLDVLENVMILNRMQYGDEIIDGIIIPNMSNIMFDHDPIVRTAVSKLLVDFCMDCESKKCLDMLDIIENMLKRPFDTKGPENVPLNESEYCDIKCLVLGVISLFRVKIHKLPSIYAIKIYEMLVTFLELHYNMPKLFQNCSEIRYLIFDCFLKMRADEFYHLGCPDSKRMKFSSYLCVTYKKKDSDSTNIQKQNKSNSQLPEMATLAISQPPQCTVTYICLRKVFKIFITCLKSEKDWEVLSLILYEMPKVLQNKSLILSKQGNNELDLLVDTLCAMITSHRGLHLPHSLNVKVSQPDFHSAVLLVLVNFASYHSYLDPSNQVKLINCLLKCIQTGPRCSSIRALTICTLEMREVMVKMLPQVLLNLSKLSATVNIAVPVLEFLSTLTQLPKVFANFVADQYMAVFAISLPYTNPFKYNHYTVSLAHHVIAVWFLKCRLPFRKDFVKFITNGLQTNVLIPFEETNSFKADLGLLNQDSSDRKRSSSLTEQGTRRRAATVCRMDKPSSTYTQRPPLDKSLITFYEELTETCIDLMARYAYSPCSALPRRLPTAEFLLNGGQSMCWSIGNKLVTVTTSGCSQKVLKHGLCDKCWTFCNKRNDSKSKDERKGSDDKDSSWATRQNSNDKSNTNTSASSPIDETKKIGDMDLLSSKLQLLVGPQAVAKNEKETCACWCQGWAEIYVRRPTGDMSWVMRIQNQISYQHSMYEFPLNDISTLYLPSLSLDTGGYSYLPRQSNSEEANEEIAAPSDPVTPSKQSPSRQNSREEDESEVIYDDGTKSRNSVRKSNSSPEMSANWKNPFMQQKQETAKEDDKNLELEDNVKKSKIYSKDMRVSCEAIPEEIAGMGTTPPSGDSFQPPKNYGGVACHPSLLSCHSYPGSSPPTDANNAKSKPYQTVPHSPNILQSYQVDFSSPQVGKSGAEAERPFNLNNFERLVLVNRKKPPQSPTQTSPRMSRHSLGHEIQKSSSSSIIERNTNMSLNLAREVARDRKNSGSIDKLSSLDPNQAQKRDRFHTISVMSPAATRKPRSDQIRQPNTRTKEAPKSGINPSFVFLQLYHSKYFESNGERPLLVGSSDVVQRAVKVLDHIPPYETHKIGVVYVREGQSNNEVEILKNRFGSLRYVDFLQNLGTLVKLSDVDPQVFFLGGLEQQGGDGKFAYIWQDDVIRVTFHVATMMPNKDSDLNCTNKKLHIGNNYVTIVYNESGEDFHINTIKGQFNFASIIIQPLDHNTNRVTIKTREELNELIGVSEPKIVSDQNVAILAKQLALHANLASLVFSSLKRSADPYASNWLERLRKIKNVRNKIVQDHKNDDSSYPPEDGNKKKQMEDFTDYT